MPRSVKPPDTLETELVGYWDGEDPAYAACVYARLKLLEPTGDLTHVAALLAGKVRVTPSKRLHHNMS